MEERLKSITGDPLENMVIVVMYLIRDGPDSDVLYLGVSHRSEFSDGDTVALFGGGFKRVKMCEFDADWQKAFLKVSEASRSRTASRFPMVQPWVERPELVQDEAIYTVNSRLKS